MQEGAAGQAAGRVALVTGGSSGIGLAVAGALSRAGARVLVAARDADKGARAVEGLAGAAFLQLDLADPASPARAAREAQALAGRPVEWLVNNAGIAVSAPLLEQEELYERHLQVNFHGARRLMETLAPGMQAAGYGRIVNVASSAGLRGYAYAAAYCASKHALVGYSRAAALELAKSGVLVGVVCPHYVDSPMTAGSVERLVQRTGRSPEEARRFFAEQNPGKRLVAVEEVAEVVLELLLGEANGRIVELDGSGRRTLEDAPAGARRT